MRIIPNDIVQNLIRHLPLILDYIDKDALRKKTRLNNAARLTRKVVKRLERIEYEQSQIKRDSE